MFLTGLPTTRSNQRQTASVFGRIRSVCGGFARKYRKFDESFQHDRDYHFSLCADFIREGMYFCLSDRFVIYLYANCQVLYLNRVLFAGEKCVLLQSDHVPIHSAQSCVNRSHAAASFCFGHPQSVAHARSGH